MGRFVKNFQFHSGSYAVRLPAVPDSSVGPAAPQNGQMRFNLEVNNIEIYYSNAWHSPANEGRVQIIKDQFVGTGSQFSYTMSVNDLVTYIPGNAACVLVFVGNVFQNPEVSYTIDGYTLTFFQAPDPGVPVVVLHNFNSTHTG